MRPGSANSYAEQLSSYIDQQESPPEAVEMGMLAKILNTSEVTVGSWVRQQEIRCIDPFARPRMVKLTDALADLKAIAAGKDSAAIAAPVVAAPPEEPEPEDAPSGSVREQMLEAAREAARDVVLRAADKAREAGDHQRRADLLEDFIHMEEGLKLSFAPRSAHA